MPFLEESGQPIDLSKRIDTPTGFAVTPGANDLEDTGTKQAWNWGAAFRRNNEMAALAASESAWTDNSPEPGFNPWDKIKGTPDEVNFKALSEARNTKKFEAIRTDIERENADRKLLDSQPWWMGLITEGTAGILSPTTLLPGGSFVKGAKGGVAIVKAGATVGAANAVSAGIQEAALQSIEQTRTAGESATAIGASLFLGGLLGAGGQAMLSKAEWQRGVAALEKEIGGAEAGPTFASLPEGLRLDRSKDSFGERFDLIDDAKKVHYTASIDYDTIPGVAGISYIRNESRAFSGVGPALYQEIAKSVAQDGRKLVIGIESSPSARKVHAKLEEMGAVREIKASDITDDADVLAHLSKPYDDGGQRKLYEVLAPDSQSSSGAARSVGAAAVRAASLEDNTIAGHMAGAVAAGTAKLNPILRALHSPSAAHREIMLDLVENPLYLQKNFERSITNEEGVEVGRTANTASPVAAETFMKAYHGGLARAIEIGSEALAEHRKAGGLMDAGEFNEAVGKAMRRNDTDADPAVQKAAQEYRARVIEPLFKAAKEVGILPADVSQTTAPSYFSRLWNSKKISADEQGFKGMVQDWVAQKAPQWAEQFDKAAERRLEPIRRELSNLEMEKLRRAEELKQRIDTADTSEMTEGDIRQALRIVQGGAPKPKGVDTLSQFVLKAGGLVDDASELAHRGITNKARPGLIRKERRTAMNANGGWTLDDMARHAWENGYFPENSQRPSIDAFVEALNDDFHKIRAVLKHGDEDAFKLTELVSQLEADLARAGVGTDGKAPRFSTSEEMKGAVERVYKALDAEADRKAAILKDKLNEREADIRADRESRFVGDPQELGRGIADEVFNTLTGRNGGGVRNDFITIKARGPMKERTFDIEDLFRSSNGKGVEDYLEHNVEEVARRYTRVMGADVEIARKYGSVDMLDQFNKIKEDYANLRAEVSAKANLTDPKARLSASEVEKQLLALKRREESDVGDLEAMRDTLRDNLSQGPQWSQSYSKAVRISNNFNYLRGMGEVAVASLSETVRPAMVHGLMPYMETLGQTLTNLKGIRLSVKEAQLAGNVTERILQTRLATLSEVTDPHAARGPMEAFLANMTNFASKWNGIALLTDMQKSIAAVMTQNRILRGSEMYGKVAEKERAYLAYLGIDQSMAERIAAQFAEHGETVEKVRVANQEKWTDEVALRHYRAAMNKDVDSIITTKGVADTPLFANSPIGRAVLQYKSFALASHQRVLLRGLQEGPARFVGGMVAMTTIGIMATWLKAISGNRTEKLQDIGENPGWWISEGLDRAGVFAVPMELSNMAEKATGFNPIKSPIKIFDKGAAGSQKNQNRNLAGAIFGPTFGTIGDVGTVAFLGSKLAKGDEITQADKNAAERLLPFNSYIGMRQMLRYVVNPQQQ